MSRKHYEALAKALRFERPHKSFEDRTMQWNCDCLAVARVLERFAPTTFDYARFLEACRETNITDALQKRGNPYSADFRYNE